MALSAVVVLLFGSGVFAGSSEEVNFKTETYKTVGDKELKIEIHYPPGWKASDRRGAIIFFFGGGWNSGSTSQFLVQADYFAGRALVAARADYRVKSRDGVGPDKCVEDARSAVRWMRKNSKRLGIDPEKLIASGGSAGGHLAACMMIKKSVEAEGDDLSISTIPQAMVLFNPVLNLTSERMLGRLDGDKKLAAKISPTVHLDKKTPPALILFGTNDGLKVFGDEYWAKAEKLGVRADKFLAEGQGHGFFNRSPWLEKTLIAADKFLGSLGYLKGEPTIKAPAETGQSGAQQRRQRSEGQRQGNTRSRDGLLDGWLTRMDKDGDKKISPDEARGQMKSNFDRIDSNSDGFIDREELGKLAQRLSRGGRRGRAHPDTSEWDSLFAADLSNADKPKGVWTVADGVMTASEDQAIWTTRDYENFVLDLEFKNAEGTNSGVVVYCTDMKNWIPNSVEIQIADDFAEKWAKSPKTWHCGAIFGHLAPSKSVVKKAGEWNRFTITCAGKQIDVVLNGEKITSMDMRLWTSAKKNPDGSDIPSWLSKPYSTLPTKGRIGLQGKHAGAPIWFRNIKVKELK